MVAVKARRGFGDPAASRDTVSQGRIPAGGGAAPAYGAAAITMRSRDRAAQPDGQARPSVGSCR